MLIRSVKLEGALDWPGPDCGVRFSDQEPTVPTTIISSIGALSSTAFDSLMTQFPYDRSAPVDETLHAFALADFRLLFVDEGVLASDLMSVHGAYNLPSCYKFAWIVSDRGRNKDIRTPETPLESALRVLGYVIHYIFRYENSSTGNIVARTALSAFNLIGPCIYGASPCVDSSDLAAAVGARKRAYSFVYHIKFAERVLFQEMANVSIPLLKTNYWCSCLSLGDSLTMDDFSLFHEWILTETHEESIAVTTNQWPPKPAAFPNLPPNIVCITAFV